MKIKKILLTLILIISLFGIAKGIFHSLGILVYEKYNLEPLIEQVSENNWVTVEILALHKSFVNNILYEIFVFFILSILAIFTLIKLKK